MSVLAAPHVPSSARLVVVIALTLALGYAVILGAALIGGHWLYDTQGQPIASDFVNVWAAGRLAVEGHAADAYDWVIHKAMEVRAVGHNFDNYYGWHYPPMFLFAAAALATLPFATAALIWLAVTLPIYLAAMRAILGNAGLIIGLGFPAALWNASAGQNGFLTAGLLGGTLALLERHPLLAGICLGLLSYKPHFALLFPIALIAARRFGTIIVAGAVSIVMALASWIAFGTEAWHMFLESTPRMANAVLSQGLAEFGRLQSMFGLVRALGGDFAIAAIAQAVVALGLAAGTWWLWSRPAPYELKAAALAAGTLLVTPYLYIYDLCVLAVAVAFLLRYALGRGLMVAEAAGLGLAALLLLIYPYLKLQVGMAAALIVLGLSVQRLFADAR